MTTAERRLAVIERAGGVCEYCRLPQSAHPQTFEVDHILPRQHGGGDALDNFALSCPHCNRHKGPNAASVTPSREAVLLFDPRRHV